MMKNKKTLQTLALMIGLVSMTAWWLTGANFGWSKTSITEMKIDELTGLEYPVTQDAFILGIEALGLGLGIAVILFALSYIFPRKKS